VELDGNKGGSRHTQFLVPPRRSRDDASDIGSTDARSANASEVELPTWKTIAFEGLKKAQKAGMSKQQAGLLVQRAHEQPY
jgi:hypothetical protein